MAPRKPWRLRRAGEDIPWTPDMKLIPKLRPYIPWAHSVGDYTSGGQMLYHYPGGGEQSAGVSSIGALAIIGAIVLAIGVYAYFTNKPQ